jgi:hypothetical protein
MDARQIALSAPFSGLCVIVTYQTGASVFWPTASGDRAAPQHVADGQHNPLACFTRGGQLVHLTREEGGVLDGQPGKFAAVATFPGPGEAPVALLPAERRDEFAVLTADGTLRVYRLAAG